MSVRASPSEIGQRRAAYASTHPTSSYFSNACTCKELQRDRYMRQSGMRWAESTDLAGLVYIVPLVQGLLNFFWHLRWMASAQGMLIRFNV
eukprot:scaffold116322_cov28-Prasinocladus_malaysianus.AAC.1